jgi:hypothetical protein
VVLLMAAFKFAAAFVVGQRMCFLFLFPVCEVHLFDARDKTAPVQYFKVPVVQIGDKRKGDSAEFRTLEQRRRANDCIDEIDGQRGRVIDNLIGPELRRLFPQLTLTGFENALSFPPQNRYCLCPESVHKLL